LKERIQINDRAFKASLDGNLETIIELYQNNNLNLEIRDDFQNSLIHNSSRFGHLNIVEYLVIQKADINSKNHNDELIHFIILLFIVLLRKAIFVLLNV